MCCSSKTTTQKTLLEMLDLVNGYRQLYKVIESGHLGIVKECVAQSIMHNGNAYALTEYAVECGQREVFEFLYEQHFCQDDQILFEKAVEYNRLPILIYLFEYVKCDEFNALFQLAAFYGHMETLKYLHDREATPKDVTDALVAASRGGKIQAWKYLVEKGADINAYHQHAFYVACKYDHVIIVETFLELEHFVPNTERGNCGLIAAVKAKHTETVRTFFWDTTLFLNEEDSKDAPQKIQDIYAFFRAYYPRRDKSSRKAEALFFEFILEEFAPRRVKCKLAKKISVPPQEITPGKPTSKALITPKELITPNNAPT